MNKGPSKWPEHGRIRRLVGSVPLRAASCNQTANRLDSDLKIADRRSCAKTIEIIRDFDVFLSARAKSRNDSKIQRRSSSNKARQINRCEFGFKDSSSKAHPYQHCRHLGIITIIKSWHLSVHSEDIFTLASACPWSSHPLLDESLDCFHSPP